MNRKRKGGRERRREGGRGEGGNMRERRKEVVSKLR